MTRAKEIPDPMDRYTCKPECITHFVNRLIQSGIYRSDIITLAKEFNQGRAVKINPSTGKPWTAFEKNSDITDHLRWMRNKGFWIEENDHGYIQYIGYLGMEDRGSLNKGFRKPERA